MRPYSCIYGLQYFSAGRKYQENYLNFGFTRCTSKTHPIPQCLVRTTQRVEKNLAMNVWFLVD